MYALGAHFMHPMNYKKSMTPLVLIDQLSVTELLHVMTSNEQTSSVVDCGFESSLGIRIMCPSGAACLPTDCCSVS